MRLGKLSAAAVAGLMAAGVLAQPGTPFKVIANPKMAGARMSRQTLSAIFLKKIVRLSDGTPLEPFDQSSTSPVRIAFSEQILGQSVAALVQTHWAKEITSGRSRPPLVKATDADVILAVGSKSGGIGYVAADAELPPTVKVLQVE